MSSHEIEKAPGWSRLLDRLEFNDLIIYKKASVDARFPDAESQDEYGSYQGKVVDFPDDGLVGSYTRVGVRADGFNGQNPIYYVRLEDIIKIYGLAVRASGPVMEILQHLAPGARLSSTPELWASIKRYERNLTADQAATLLTEANYQDTQAELSGDGKYINIYGGGPWPFPWPVFTIQG